MVAIAQLVESRIVIPVVKGSSPFSHPILQSSFAGVAKLVDAPDLGSGALGVRVRVSSPAPPLNKQLLVAFFVSARTQKISFFSYLQDCFNQNNLATSSVETGI